MHTVTARSIHPRNFFFALAVGLLAVVLLGEIGRVAVHSTQHRAQPELRA
jgi:hypothetical protein